MGDDSDAHGPQPFTAEERAPYSSELLRLIEDCVEYAPDDRPTFDRVLQRIRDAVDPTKANCASGLREADPGHSSFNNLQLRGDQYKLRTAFQGIPSGATRSDNFGLAGGTIPPPPPDSSSSESNDSYTPSP